MKSIGILIATMTVLAASPGAAAERQRFVRSFSMPSQSMRPTLEPGDVIIAYGFVEPRRGDVIVFTPSGKTYTLAKRLIGMSGDRVQMKGGVLWLNGEALPRLDEGTGPAEACWNGQSPRRIRETLPGGRSYRTYDCGPLGDLDDTPVLVVPVGHYFVMGDHRDNSLDSRVGQEEGGPGFVPMENLIGVAKTIRPSAARRAAGENGPITIE